MTWFRVYSDHFFDLAEKPFPGAGSRQEGPHACWQLLLVHVDRSCGDLSDHGHRGISLDVGLCVGLAQDAGYLRVHPDILPPIGDNSLSHDSCELRPTFWLALLPAVVDL